jgi:Flp pilus assembly pilin Flp
MLTMLTMASVIGPNRRLWRRRAGGPLGDRRGLAASEYALIAAGIVVIVGGATIAFRSNLLEAFAEIGTRIIGTADRIAGRTDGAGPPAASAARGADDGGTAPASAARGSEGGAQQ